MNIIEQAAKRLEELQRAGVDVPWSAGGIGEASSRGAAQAPTLPPASRPPGALPAFEANQRRSSEVELDLNRLVRHGHIVPGMARSAIADEFRVIKRPILKNAAQTGAQAIRRGNLIAVTSALPGEGKTFTAVNLALSISMELDHSVLLVDADVVRPSALSVLGLKAERGLMDVLRDPTIDLSSVLLKPSNLPKLTLLPAGLGALNSTELLASAAMERLLDELASTYADRIVIFDAPPLMVTTESRVLASRVGQVLLVVEAAHTPRHVVSEAFATVSNCPIVLTVLNKYTGPSKVGMYGY